MSRICSQIIRRDCPLPQVIRSMLRATLMESERIRSLRRESFYYFCYYYCCYCYYVLLGTLEVVQVVNGRVFKSLLCKGKWVATWRITGPE